MDTNNAIRRTGYHVDSAQNPNVSPGARQNQENQGQILPDLQGTVSGGRSTPTSQNQELQVSSGTGSFPAESSSETSEQLGSSLGRSLGMDFQHVRHFQENSPATNTPSSDYSAIDPGLIPPSTATGGRGQVTRVTAPQGQSPTDQPSTSQAPDTMVSLPGPLSVTTQSNSTTPSTTAPQPQVGPSSPPPQPAPSNSTPVQSSGPPSLSPRIPPEQLDRTPLPYTGTDVQGHRQWNGANILNNLGQHDQMTGPHDPGGSAHGTDTDAHRCSASAVLAQSIIRGPDDVNRVIDNLERNRRNNVVVPGGNPNQDLEDIRQRINSGQATYSDLSRLQDRMHQSAGGGGGFNRDAGSLNSLQVVRMQRQAGATNGRGTVEIREGPQNTLNRIDNPQAVHNGPTLRHPGDSFIMNVDTDGDRVANHYVTVGRDQSNNVYIYDPEPLPGQGNLIYRDRESGRFNQYINQMGEGAQSNRHLIVGNTMHNHPATQQQPVQ